MEKDEKFAVIVILFVVMCIVTFGIYFVRYNTGFEDGIQEGYRKNMSTITLSDGYSVKIKSQEDTDGEYWNTIAKVAMLSCKKYSEYGEYEGECFDFEPYYVSKWSCNTESEYGYATTIEQ